MGKDSVLFRQLMRQLKAVEVQALGYTIEDLVYNRMSQRLLAPAGANAPVAASELRFVAGCRLEDGALVAELTLFGEYFATLLAGGASPAVRARRIADLCRYQALGDAANELQVRETYGTLAGW